MIACAALQSLTALQPRSPRQQEARAPRGVLRRAAPRRSENIVSKAVLEAQGSIMTNKYAEGCVASRAPPPPAAASGPGPPSRAAARAPARRRGACGRYAGKRYYGGCEYVDVAERLAVERPPPPSLVLSGHAASLTPD